jgi:hypothetical protein
MNESLREAAEWHQMTGRRCPDAPKADRAG